MRSPHAASSRPARLAAPVAILASLFACAALLAGCEPAPVVEPLPADRLVVAVRMGPGTWNSAPDAAARGFEHDLLALFAADAGLPVVALSARNAEDLGAMLSAGKAHLGVGGLYRPRDGAPPADANARSLALAWTAGFHPVEPVVVYQREGYRPRKWADLDGAEVAYLRVGGFDAGIDALSLAHPGVRFAAADLPSAEALIARVNEGQIDYGIVSSMQAAISRHVYLNFDVAFRAGPGHELAWLVPRAHADLREKLDAFIAKAKRDGVVARLADRYFGHGQEVQRVDAGVFQERIRAQLPEFRRLFQEAQAQSGVDWRLLAAVAYQESQWDPLATSETGVRGFMQLTEDTARHLGVTDRLDPRQSVMGAARYLRDLKERLPARIQEPDRTWLALAAYNIGLGHLEDARVLAQAQKLSPDHWRDMKQALPLLALPEYHEKTKLGYARGGMPVAFVDRVRTYYDILLWHEATPRMRLRAGR